MSNSLLPFSFNTNLCINKIKLRSSSGVYLFSLYISMPFWTGSNQKERKRERGIFRRAEHIKKMNRLWVVCTAQQRAWTHENLGPFRKGNKQCSSSRREKVALNVVWTRLYTLWGAVAQLWVITRFFTAAERKVKQNVSWTCCVTRSPLYAAFKRWLLENI